MTLSSTGTYQSILKDAPRGLDGGILDVLKMAGCGRGNALGRNALLDLLDAAGFRANERAVRQAIHDLRRAGWLICSAPGEDGGYYLAATREEFDEFCQRELHPKAMDMLETESAMKASARRMWGEAVQMELIP
jgi:DNA-binding transcriptional regulator PaaX